MTKFARWLERWWKHPEQHNADCVCGEVGGHIGWKYHTVCSLRKLAADYRQDVANNIYQSEARAALALADAAQGEQ